jgi:ABC-type multidrug transport system fused ATPase/permease subunit
VSASKNFEKIIELVNEIDLEIVSDLLLQPTILCGILRLLERIHEFMRMVGLRMKEHFLIEISRWTDYEVEGWSYLQIKIKLLALNNINLTINDNEIVKLIGPNGSGKPHL